jgi:hypothetical protein
MASLENLHCPQYVDFTSPEAFELNDGADFFFGNYKSSIY